MAECFVDGRELGRGIPSPSTSGTGFLRIWRGEPRLALVTDGLNTETLGIVKDGRLVVVNGGRARNVADSRAFGEETSVISPGTMVTNVATSRRLRRRKMKAATQAMTTTITAAMAPPIAAEAFLVGEF